MLSPKKVKRRKVQTGRMKGMSSRSNFVAYGTYGLKALEPGWLTSRQIEATRISISRESLAIYIYIYIAIAPFGDIILYS